MLPRSISRGTSVRRADYMESANFIAGVNQTLYNRYISLGRSCILNPQFLDLIIELKNRDPVSPGQYQREEQHEASDVLEA